MLDQEQLQAVEARIAEFKEQTGMDFFEAIPRFYDYINEDLLPFVPFTMEQVGDCFDQVYNNLLYIVNNRDNKRDVINWKRIDSYFEDSFNRCLGLRRLDTTAESYLIMENFIDEDLLRDIIVNNPHKGRNPLMLCNGMEWTIPCIFQPSLSLRKKYPFITQKVWPDWRLIWAEIDTELLKKEVKIYINDDDIVRFYYGLYHPYIWSLVQSKQWSKLVHEVN